MAAKSKLCVVTAEDKSGEIIGIAPFYIERESNLPLSTRRIRLIGDGGDGEYLTEEPAILLRSGCEQRAGEAILQYLTTSSVARQWDALYFYEAGDYELSSIREEHLKPILGRRLFETMSWPGAEIVRLPDSWLAYRATLSRSMKDNLPYYPRKLSKHVGEWSVQEVRDPIEIVDATRQLIRLHTERSRTKRGIPHENHLHGEGPVSFLEEMMVELARQKKRSSVF